MVFLIKNADFQSLPTLSLRDPATLAFAGMRPSYNERVVGLAPSYIDRVALQAALQQGWSKSGVFNRGAEGESRRKFDVAPIYKSAVGVMRPSVPQPPTNARIPERWRPLHV